MTAMLTAILENQARVRERLRDEDCPLHGRAASGETYVTDRDLGDEQP